MRIALTYVGKIIGLLGGVCIIGAFTALATNDPAGVRLLRFVWVLAVGAGLLAAGIWIMRRSRHRG